MLISVDESASKWFTNEFESSQPISIRLFPQYAGFGQKHKGYSLALSAEMPVNAKYSKDVNDITFFFEEFDSWFFDDIEICLSLDEQDELQILFKELSK